MIFRRCLWLLLIALAGCATKPQPVTTPIDQIYFQSRASPSENLIVFLPGIGDEPKAFLDEGFVQAVRDRNIDADLVGKLLRLGAPAPGRRGLESGGTGGIEQGSQEGAGIVSEHLSVRRVDP